MSITSAKLSSKDSGIPSASSFSFLYLLISLRSSNSCNHLFSRVPVTSVFPSIHARCYQSSYTSFSLMNLGCSFPHWLSNTYFIFHMICPTHLLPPSPAPNFKTFKYFWSDFHSVQVSAQKLCYKCSISLLYIVNLSLISWWKVLFLLNAAVAWQFLNLISNVHLACNYRLYQTDDCRVYRHNSTLHKQLARGVKLLTWSPVPLTPTQTRTHTHTHTKGSTKFTETEEWEQILYTNKS